MWLPVRAHFWDPLCSVSLRKWLSNVSITVSCTMMCYEIVPSSWVSLWIDTISADSTWSGMLVSPREVLFAEASCLCQASMHCLRQNNCEVVVSSDVCSPKFSPGTFDQRQQ